MALTFAVPTERTPYHIDGDGWPVFVRHKDTVAPIAIDWTDKLDSGETVSTSSWEAHGVTASSASLVSPVATVTVTGTDGWVKNTVVTSASRTLIQIAKFHGVPEGSDITQDYDLGR
jgi:hypothetical protein